MTYTREQAEKIADCVDSMTASPGSNIALNALINALCTAPAAPAEQEAGEAERIVRQLATARFGVSTDAPIIQDARAWCERNPRKEKA